MCKNFGWFAVIGLIMAALLTTFVYAVPDENGNPGGLITGQRFLIKVGKAMFNDTDVLLTTGSSGLLTNVTKQTGAITLTPTTVSFLTEVSFGTATITDKNDQVVTVLTSATPASALAVTAEEVVGGSAVVTNIVTQRVP